MHHRISLFYLQNLDVGPWPARHCRTHEPIGGKREWNTNQEQLEKIPVELNQQIQHSLIIQNEGCHYDCEYAITPTHRIAKAVDSVLRKIRQCLRVPQANSPSSGQIGL